MPFYPLLVLEVASGPQVPTFRISTYLDPQVPTFRISTYLDPQVGLVRGLGVRQKFPGLASWNLASLDAPPLRAVTNSLKLGLFILRRTSNCSQVNRTELCCSSSLSSSSWSSRVIGSSSPIDFGGTTRSSLGSSNMVSWACF
jgi:hypothetical protein